MSGFYLNELILRLTTRDDPHPDLFDAYSTALGALAAGGAPDAPLRVFERRLLEAKRLLMFTIRSVEDIAAETGFRDPAYFSRFFRKRVGSAPGEWRRQQTGG